MGPCPLGMESRHRDGNPENNHKGNLLWGTHLENMADKKMHGRQPIGEQTASHKLSESDVLRIREIHGTKPLREIAAEYGVSHTAIRRAALGIKWTHLQGGANGR